MTVEVPELSVFTEILERKIPGVILAESQRVFAILTQSAVLDRSGNPMRGHTLIIPTNPKIQNFWEMDKYTRDDFGSFKALLGLALLDVFDGKKVEEFVS